MEAARIIKVDLDAFSSRSSSGGLEGTVKRGILFSGKEEWVLRWLLKRLETQGNCARLDPQAWVLMRHLLGRIPVVNAARLLSAHDFLQLLETSLEGGLTQAHEQGVLSTGDSKGSIDISDESGSSSTLVDNTTSTSPKQSKKRKRPGASVQGDSRTSFSDSCKPKMDILFCAIVGSFNQLVDMIAEPKSGEEDFEGQYIIAVLRSSPDRAASILRSALRTAAYLIRDEKFTGAAISNDSISPIAPFAVVWEHRSVNTDDLSGRASNVGKSRLGVENTLTSSIGSILLILLDPGSYLVINM